VTAIQDHFDADEKRHFQPIQPTNKNKGTLVDYIMLLMIMAD